MFGDKIESNRIYNDLNQLEAASSNIINTYISENGYSSIRHFDFNLCKYINRFCRFQSKTLKTIVSSDDNIGLSVGNESSIQFRMNNKYVFQALCSFELYLQEYTSKKTFLLDELLKDAFTKYPVFSPANTKKVWFDNVKRFVNIEANYVDAPTDVPSTVTGLSLKRDKAYNDYKKGLITSEQYADVCAEYDRATSYNRMPPILYEAKYDDGTEYGQRIDVTKYLLDRLRVKEYKEGGSPTAYNSGESVNAFSDYLEEFAAKYRR